MSRPVKDLSGQRFGHLTVLKMSDVQKLGKNCNHYFDCKCDCGNIVSVRSDNLTTGHSTKCKECARLYTRFGRKKVKWSYVGRKP